MKTTSFPARNKPTYDYRTRKRLRLLEYGDITRNNNFSDSVFTVQN